MTHQNYRGYQHLNTALTLSPSNKAMTRLEGERVCIVRLWEDPERIRYFFSVINFITGIVEVEGKEINLIALQIGIRDSGLSLEIDQRIWMALEWWIPLP